MGDKRVVIRHLPADYTVEELVDSLIGAKVVAERVSLNGDELASWFKVPGVGLFVLYKLTDESRPYTGASDMSRAYVQFYSVKARVAFERNYLDYISRSPKIGERRAVLERAPLQSDLFTRTPKELSVVQLQDQALYKDFMVASSSNEPNQQEKVEPKARGNRNSSRRGGKQSSTKHTGSGKESSAVKHARGENKPTKEMAASEPSKTKKSSRRKDGNQSSKAEASAKGKASSTAKSKTVIKSRTAANGFTIKINKVVEGG